MPDVPSQTDTYATALDIFDKTHPLRVDVDENLKVTGAFTTTPSGVQAVCQSGPWTVSLVAEPTIDIGKVGQGPPNAGGALAWPVVGTFTFSPSTSATTVAESIGTSPVLVLGTNLNRKGFAIQNTNQVVYVKLDSTVSTALYSYELPRKGILEIENYCGPVSAVTLSGTVIVMVTEKV